MAKDGQQERSRAPWRAKVKVPVCKWWLKNDCRHGKSCRYAHRLPEKPKLSLKERLRRQSPSPSTEDDRERGQPSAPPEPPDWVKDLQVSCKEIAENVGTFRAMLDLQSERLDAMEKAQKDMEKAQKATEKAQKEHRKEQKDMWAAMKSHKACIDLWQEWQGSTQKEILERATVATVEAQETRLDLLQANIMSMQSEQNALRGMVQGVATQMLIRPPVVVQPQLTRAVGAGQQHQQQRGQRR